MRRTLFALFITAGSFALSKGGAQTLPYGPNQCKVGYVFREAWTNDQVCVTPATRTQVARDNAAAKGNISLGPYGPDQCRNGLVWRGARPTDHVCVTPQQRDLARQDHYYDFSRKQMRIVNHDKPMPPPKKSSGIKPDGDTGGFHPGAGGLEECKVRYVCPPRMEAAVEDNTCACSSR